MSNTIWQGSLEELDKKLLTEDSGTYTIDNETLSKLLNNFHCHFEDTTGDSFYRIMQKGGFNLDTTRRISFSEKVAMPFGTKEASDFYADVDAILINLGIADTLKTLLLKRYSPKAVPEIHNLLLPVYITLRKKGYTRKKLTT